jgi:hypothetical protein
MNENEQKAGKAGEEQEKRARCTRFAKFSVQLKLLSFAGGKLHCGISNAIAKRATLTRKMRK